VEADYYLEMDVTVRGVSLGDVSFLEGHGASTFDGMCDADPYRQMCDTSPRWPAASFGDEKPWETRLQFGMQRAPAVPRDPLEKLSDVNCIRLDCVCASEAVDRVLGALEKQIGVSITKVRRQKFWLSFTACSFEASCDAKVYIYQETEGGELSDVDVVEAGTVVEFQRRRGDASVFNAVLQATTAQVVSWDVFELDATSFNSLSTSSSPSLPVETEPQDLQPLLDMVQARQFNGGNADTQAEVAFGLNRAVSEGGAKVATQFCTPDSDAESTLEGLLSAEDFCVAYPASQLLATLLPFENGAARLLKLAVSRLKSKTFDRNVNNVLASAVQFFAPFVIEQLAMGVAEALEDLLGHAPNDLAHKPQSSHFRNSNTVFT